MTEGAILFSFNGCMCREHSPVGDVERRGQGRVGKNKKEDALALAVAVAGMASGSKAGLEQVEGLRQAAAGVRRGSGRE